MLLHDYLDRYNRTHDIRASTLIHYHWVVRSYERHNGHAALADLSGESVNDWLIHLRDLGRSPWTIKQRRISLLVLWRAAWDEDLAPPIRGVRRLRPCHYSPTAWTTAEVRQLIASSEAGPRPLWTGSLVRTGYDTALRLGDLLAIRVGQMTSNLLQITQHKTGLPVCLQLRPDTLRAIRRQVDQIPGPLIWPLWGRREAFYRHFRRVVRSAGIRAGTFRWLRRAAITACERQQSGAGTLLAGHASRATTERWYIDQAQLAVPPLPPL